MLKDYRILATTLLERIGENGKAVTGLGSVELLRDTSGRGV
jgi:hypothetical protein